MGATLSSPVQAGDVIAGKYRVDRVLGAGGMGIVVAATHVHLNEPVAVKFLLPDARPNPAAHARFLREAQTQGAGCSAPVQEYTSAQYPGGIALQGTNVFYTTRGAGPDYNTGTVSRCGVPCVGPELFATQLALAKDIVIGGIYLFWIEEGINPGDFQSGRIMRCEASSQTCNTTKVAIASGQGRPSALAADQFNVYWTNEGTPSGSDGTVDSCAFSGCPASGPIRLDQGLSTPSGVAVDDKAVYWTNTYAAGGGAVYKRAKP